MTAWTGRLVLRDAAPASGHLVLGAAPAATSQVLLPDGLDAARHGATALRWTQYLAATGYATPAFGDYAWVSNRLRYLGASGWDAAGFGAITTAHPGPPQTLAPAGWDSAALPAAAELRRINPWTGHLLLSRVLPVSGHLVLGRLPGDDVPRALAPNGLAPGDFGDAALANRNRTLPLSGWDASAFGLPVLPVRGPAQRLYPASVGDAAAFGAARLEWKDRPLPVAGFETRVFGGSLVAYRVRTVDLDGDGVDGQAFGGAAIAFRTFRPVPPGFDGFAAGDAWVSRSPRSLFPAGFQADAIGGAALGPPSPVIAGGLDSAAPGPFLAVENRNRTVAVYGFAGFRAGTALLDIVPRLFGQGYDAAVFGQTLIAPWVRALPLPGFDAATLPAGAAVWTNRREIAAPSLGDVALYGVTQANDYDRPAPVQGFDAAGFGAALAGFYRQLLGPRPIAPPVPGRPALGYRRELAPQGWDGAWVERPYLHDTTQTVYPVGKDLAAFGRALMDRSPRLLLPQGFETAPSGGLIDFRWGRPELSRNPRPIAPHFNDDAGWPGVSAGALIENRNRPMAVYGFAGFKAGRPALDLGPVAAPAGFAADEYGRALVAFRVRAFALDGFDAQGFPLYTEIVNAARQVWPASGGDAARFGAAALVNTRRYFDYIGGQDHAAPGQAYVDFGVRTLAPLFPPDELPLPEPVVGFRSRPVAPAGFDAAQFSNLWVEEHFTVIAPRWVFRDRIGDGWVRNVTPDVRPYAYDLAEYGRPTVGLYTRRIVLDGYDQSGTGWPFAHDRRQTVQARGVVPPALGTGHALANLLDLVLPAPQAITPEGLFEAKDEAFRVGAPTLSYQGAWPDGWNGFAAGKPSLVTMAIGPAGGIFLPLGNSIDGVLYQGDTMIGHPWVRGPQYVMLENTATNKHDGILGEAFGVARGSPYTIWCWESPPDQAIACNPPNQKCPPLLEIDEDTGLPVQFGHPSVTTTLRWVTVSGTAWGEIGAGATVDYRQRRLEPTGWRSQRFGVPKLPGGEAREPVGFDSLEFGQAEMVPRPVGAQALPVEGWDGAAAGAARVDNQIRELAPESFGGETVGSARVHPPEPVIPAGFDPAGYGLAWIAYRRRSLVVGGFDAAMLSQSSGSFAQRAAVKRGKPVFGRGFTAFKAGVGRVSNKNRTLAPKGLNATRWNPPRVQNKKRVLRVFSVPHWMDPVTKHTVRHA